MLVVRCVFITARAPKLVTLVGTGVTPVLERTLASTHPVTSSQITGHCRHWHSLAAPGWHDRLTGWTTQQPSSPTRQTGACRRRSSTGSPDPLASLWVAPCQISGQISHFPGRGPEGPATLSLPAGQLWLPQLRTDPLRRLPLPPPGPGVPAACPALHRLQADVLPGGGLQHHQVRPLRLPATLGQARQAPELLPLLPRTQHLPQDVPHQLQVLTLPLQPREDGRELQHGTCSGGGGGREVTEA